MMTLYKALSVSEELSCNIIHREAGLKIKSNDTELDFLTLPLTGWEVDDAAMPVEFECLFLGCDLMENDLPGGKKGAVYSFEGADLRTFMPSGTPVKVRIEPL